MTIKEPKLEMFASHVSSAEPTYLVSPTGARVFVSRMDDLVMIFPEQPVVLLDGVRNPNHY